MSRSEIGGCVLRELGVFCIRAFYFEFIEKHRGADDARWDWPLAVADERIVANGDEIAAEGAHVEFAEDRAANEFFVAVLGVNAIEKARSGAAHGLDAIGVGLALVVDHLDDALLKSVGRLRFGTFYQEDAETWRR